MIRKLVIAFLLLLSSTHVLALSEEACLAETIYREARGEQFLGRVAVAQVVINRTKDARFPKTICKVVFQPGQFTWTPEYRKPLANADSRMIARMVMDGSYTIQDFPATYFAQKKLHPAWKVTKVRTIGNHTFYKSREIMKDYTKNGILANAYLQDNSFSDPEYVAEYVAETKPSRAKRDVSMHKAFKESYGRARRDEDLDD